MLKVNRSHNDSVNIVAIEGSNLGDRAIGSKEIMYGYGSQCQGTVRILQEPLLAPLQLSLGHHVTPSNAIGVLE